MAKSFSGSIKALLREGDITFDLRIWRHLTAGDIDIIWNYFHDALMRLSRNILLNIGDGLSPSQK